MTWGCINAVEAASQQQQPESTKTGPATDEVPGFRELVEECKKRRFVDTRCSLLWHRLPCSKAAELDNKFRWEDSMTKKELAAADKKTREDYKAYWDMCKAIKVPARHFDMEYTCHGCALCESIRNADDPPQSDCMSCMNDADEAERKEYKRLCEINLASSRSRMPELEIDDDTQEMLHFVDHLCLKCRELPYLCVQCGAALSEDDVLEGEYAPNNDYFKAPPEDGVPEGMHKIYRCMGAGQQHDWTTGDYNDIDLYVNSSDDDDDDDDEEDEDEDDEDSEDEDDDKDEEGETKENAEQPTAESIRVGSKRTSSEAALTISSSPHKMRRTHEPDPEAGSPIYVNSDGEDY